MANTKKIRTNFKGMNYREVQGANSKNRIKLNQDNQQWLKIHGYRNVGWVNVINLYQKIEGFLERERWKEFSLEELFLEADRIGNKYLSGREIADFNQRLSQEVNAVAEEIDRQFPDTEIEVMDFSGNANKSSQKSRYKKYSKLVRDNKK